eukprot:scaffold3867_cov150-Ochromonas_danica.AAC.12
MGLTRCFLRMDQHQDFTSSATGGRPSGCAHSELAARVPSSSSSSRSFDASPAGSKCSSQFIAVQRLAGVINTTAVRDEREGEGVQTHCCREVVREPQDLPGTTANRRIILVQMCFGFPFCSPAADDDDDELSFTGRRVSCLAGGSSRGGLSGAGRIETVGRSVGAGSSCCVGGRVGACVELVVVVFCVFDREVTYLLVGDSQCARSHLNEDDLCG